MFKQILATLLFIIVTIAVILSAWWVQNHQPEPQITQAPPTMCEITQNSQLHIMPCRIVREYLAEIAL
jgi:hypothetical protein